MRCKYAKKRKKRWVGLRRFAASMVLASSIITAAPGFAKINHEVDNVGAQKIAEKKKEVLSIDSEDATNLFKAIQDGFNPSETHKKEALNYLTNVLKRLGNANNLNKISGKIEKEIKKKLVNLVNKKFENQDAQRLIEAINSIRIADMWSNVVDDDKILTIEELNRRNAAEYAADYIKLAGILAVLSEEHTYLEVKYDLDDNNVDEIIRINNSLRDAEAKTSADIANLWKRIPEWTEELMPPLKLQYFPDLFNTALRNAKPDMPEQVLLEGEALGFANERGWPIIEKEEEVNGRIVKNRYVDARELFGNIDHLHEFMDYFLMSRYGADKIIEALDIEDNDVKSVLKDDSLSYNEKTDALLEYVAKNSERYKEKLKSLVEKGYEDIPRHSFTALLSFAEAAESLKKTVETTMLAVHKNLMLSEVSVGWNPTTGNWEFDVSARVAYSQFGESIENAERYGLIGISGEINYRWGSGVVGMRYTVWNDMQNWDKEFYKELTHQFNIGSEQMLGRHFTIGAISDVSGGRYSWRGSVWAPFGYRSGGFVIKAGPEAGFTWINLANIAEAQLGIENRALANIITSGIERHAWYAGGKVETNIPLSNDVNLIITGSTGMFKYGGEEFLKYGAGVGIRWDNEWLPISFTASYSGIR